MASYIGQLHLDHYRPEMSQKCPVSSGQNCIIYRTTALRTTIQWALMCHNKQFRRWWYWGRGRGRRRRGWEWQPIEMIWTATRTMTKDTWRFTPCFPPDTAIFYRHIITTATILIGRWTPFWCCMTPTCWPVLCYRLLSRLTSWPFAVIRPRNPCLGSESWIKWKSSVCNKNVKM